MKTLNLSVITRKEIKQGIAQAVMSNDIIAAKIRFVILEEMITNDGFDTTEEISEFYQVQQLIKSVL